MPLAAGAAVMAAALTLAGCGSGDGDSAPAKPNSRSPAPICPPPAWHDGGGFFTVTNSGGADTLTSVTSDLSDDVTLHSTKAARWRRRSRSPCQDGTLDFASGGNHLMFEKLTHKPEQGEKVSVSCTSPSPARSRSTCR